MTDYEELLDEAVAKGCAVAEVDFYRKDGLTWGNWIGIRNTIDTTAQKADVLAEEIGHYLTTVGNILDQNITTNRKQEFQARLYAYNKRIGLVGIIKAFESGCSNSYEAAECLGVQEAFFQEAIDCYRHKYGTHVVCDNYIIFFEPFLAVMRMEGNL